MPVDSDLALALELADLADSITLSRFRASDLTVETKPDMTPVSEADRAVERALRERLARDRPDEPVLGEEEGGSEAETSARWILDPIDATRNYVRGIPVFATLIALEREGEVTVGVVSAPALGQRWWAARGAGAFCDGRPLRVSAIERVEDAVVTYTSAADFFAAGLGDAFEQLTTRAWAPRGYGDFWQYMLLAEGAVDVAVECEAALWDLAAPQVIVEEAGGRFTDFNGDRTPAGGTCLASNGRLHDEILGAVARARTA
jgi:histidinol-phosphatase